jgi:hypothetical protein
MPNKRNINLIKYGISRGRYIELAGFCQQYPEWKQKLRHDTSSLKGQQLTGMPFGSGISDSTGNLGIKRAELSKNCQTVERTLLETITTITDGHGHYLFPGDFSGIYDLMLLALTEEDVTYTWLSMVKGIPVSRGEFYKLKKHFFVLLNENKCG